jgi:DNA modification methylase
MNKHKFIRGFLFACTKESESKCLNNLLFATDQVYAPITIRVRKGDLLFLNNIDTDILHGVFRAVSDGFYNKEDKVFAGRYPYQIQVEPLGDIIKIQKARTVLAKQDSSKRNKPIFGKKLANLLNYFAKTSSSLPVDKDSKSYISSSTLLEEMGKIALSKAALDIESEIPLVETTTFWDFPRQSYGLTPKGNNKYAGVTPALIIYNMIWRYTNPGDLVVDPMCGSGTTIDVCKEEKRNVIGYDIVSTRPDIIQNDSRNIPLEDDSVDMVFIDSPYGDNIKYNYHPNNIGNLSSESEEFYDELEKVMKESHRILKDGKVLGWLIGDQWVKKKFTPVGFEIYKRLCKYFEPVDIICVSRRGQSSNTDAWSNRARRFNFYLRGFKYLIIVRKTAEVADERKRRKIKWASYNRGI